MGNNALKWADQTLNVGMQEKVPPHVLAQMAQLLAGLGASVFDVQFTVWQRYGQVISQFDFAPSLRAVVRPWRQEILFAGDAGFRRIAVAYPLQPAQTVTDELVQALDAASQRAIAVSLYVVNAAAVRPQLVRALYSLIAYYGVKSLIVGDQGSRLEPFAAAKQLAALASTAPCAVEFHGHNNMGLGVANALGALRAGVRQVAAAVAGIGSCGHPPVEELLLASQYLLGKEVKVSADIAANCAAILGWLGLDVPAGKPIIGKCIFYHESGIHVNGIIKDSRLYEPFPPEAVGMTRQIVIGKHSGATSIKAKFAEWGLTIDDRTADLLLLKVRRLAVMKKRPLQQPLLKQLYSRLKRQCKPTRQEVEE